MLTGHRLPNFSGLELRGDYLSLYALYDLCADLSESSPLIVGEAAVDTLMGFCYELRKTYEGHRGVFEPPSSWSDIGKRFGFKLLWPQAFVYERALRQCLIANDKGAEAWSLSYGFQASIESILEDEFQDKSEGVRENWFALTEYSVAGLALLDRRSAYFASLSNSERRQFLPAILRSFDPSWQHHQETSRHAGKPLPPLTSIDGWLSNLDVWPDPRWD